MPGPPAESMLLFLEPTEVVQVNHPTIAALAGELTPDGSPAVTALRRIFDFCSSLPGPDDSVHRYLCPIARPGLFEK